ncbi:hypothetical protein Tco_0581672 [Tanacetum coccineum]
METTVGNNHPTNDRILEVRMLLDPIWLVTMRRMAMKEHVLSAISGRIRGLLRVLSVVHKDITGRIIPKSRTKTVGTKQEFLMQEAKHMA